MSVLWQQGCVFSRPSTLPQAHASVLLVPAHSLNQTSFYSGIHRARDAQSVQQGVPSQASRLSKCTRTCSVHTKLPHDSFLSLSLACFSFYSPPPPSYLSVIDSWLLHCELDIGVEMCMHCLSSFSSRAPRARLHSAVSPLLAGRRYRAKVGGNGHDLAQAFPASGCGGGGRDSVWARAPAHSLHPAHQPFIYGHQKSRHCKSLSVSFML